MSEMHRKGIVVHLTPRQAMEAADALQRAAIGKESSRLFGAAHAVSWALREAGWDDVNVGTDDVPRWVWQKEVAA